MLRNETQARLNELLVAMRQSADIYADDAETLGEDTPLADIFRDLSARREAASDELAEHVRRLGDLPQMPDTDRETLVRLGKRLKAALEANEESAFLRDRIAAEDELLRKAQLALERDIPEDTRTFLHQVRREVCGARRRLEAAREAHRS